MVSIEVDRVHSTDGRGKWGDLKLSAEKTDALVIRQVDFSESSRIVTMFTRDFGKIAAMAKGARRIKGPFDAALDLLTACRIVFLRKSSGSLDLLTEAQLIRRFQPQAGQLSHLYAGYYVAELLDALSEAYDPHPRLYDEALTILDRLSGSSRPDVNVLRFEMILLREIGLLPNFEECVFCGQTLVGATTAAEQRLFFKVSQGGLVCSQCQREETAHLEISAGTAALLRTLSAETSAWQNLVPSPRQARELRALANATFNSILGHRPKMQRYLSA